MRDSVRATRIERRSKVIRRRQGKGQRAIEKLHERETGRHRGREINLHIDKQTDRESKMESETKTMHVNIYI